MIPPPDGGYASAWHLDWRFARAFRILATVARAWLPLPSPTAANPRSVWNWRSRTTIMQPSLAPGVCRLPGGFRT